jgi:hypothetical protein
MGETWGEAFIVCPYCDYRRDDSWEMMDENDRRELHCEKCDRAFVCESRTETVYSTEPKRPSE